MKKISSFIQLWIIWFVLAFKEADDSPEYCSLITVLFIAIGLTVLIIPIFIVTTTIGWSWFVLTLDITAYLFIGIIYNEWMRKEFGHRVFP